MQATETGQLRKAIIYMVSSAFCFSAMQIFIKLSKSAVPTFQQLFFRNLIVLWLMIFLMYRAKVLDQLWKVKTPFRLLTRSIFGFLGMMAYFYSNRFIPAANASALQKVSPFFILILSVLIFGEKFTTRKLLSLVLAFSGVLFVIKPTYSPDIIPSLIAFMSAVFSSVAYLSIFGMKGKVHNYVIIFYFSLFSTICSIPLMLAVWKPLPPMQWIYLLLLGLSAGGGQFFITLAYKTANPGEVSVFNYSGIIFSAILGIIFFGEWLDIWSVIGILLIIAGGYLVYLSGKRQRSITN